MEEQRTIKLRSPSRSHLVRLHPGILDLDLSAEPVPASAAAGTVIVKDDDQVTVLREIPNDCHVIARVGEALALVDSRDLLPAA
ncbi:MAG TPA: hypothetical protein VGE39_00490 [Prosthecobacter sp.]